MVARVIVDGVVDEVVLDMEMGAKVFIKDLMEMEMGREMVLGMGIVLTEESFSALMMRTS